MSDATTWCVTAMPWRAGIALATDVRAGQLIRVRAGCMRTLISLSPIALKLDGRAMEAVERYSVEAKRADRAAVIGGRVVITVRCPRDVASGEVVTLVTGGVGTDSPVDLPPLWSGAGKAFALSGQRWRFETLVADALDDGTWRDAAPPLYVRTTPGPADTLEAYTRPDGGVVLRYLDAMLNPTAPDGATADVAGRAVDLPADAAAVVVYCNTAGSARVIVTDARGRRAVASPRPLAIDGTPVWFGDFHWHTAFSGDGERDWADAVRAARAESAFDFTGPADHLNWANSYPGGHSVTEQAALAGPLDEPGRFVVVPTFELSGREGHANVIADSWQLLIELAEAVGKATLPRDGVYPLRELAALIPPGRGLLVPHHTNMDSQVRENAVAPDGRPVWCAFDWGLTPELNATRLFEMHQGRGSFEDEVRDPAWRIDYGGLGASARTALTRGFRIANWVNVVTHGATPGDEIDDTEAIQRALDAAAAGQSTVYLPRGDYRISAQLQVGGSVRRVIGFWAGLRAHGDFDEQGGPVLRINPGQPVVILEGLRIQPMRWHQHQYRGGIVHNADNTLVFRHGSAGYYFNAVPGGKAFFDDARVFPRITGPQQVWIRQWNPETGPGPQDRAVNDGGTLWVLMTKGEGMGPFVRNLHGARTELLGGLAVYPNHRDKLRLRDPDTDVNFINTDASLTVTGWKTVFNHFLLDTQAGDEQRIASGTFDHRTPLLITTPPVAPAPR